MPIPSLRKNKVWEIVSNSRSPIQGILHFRKDGSAVPLAFGKKTNAMRVRDEGLAKEIAEKYDARYGGNGAVVTLPVDDIDSERPGQRAYKKMWAVPKMPWKDE